MRAIYDAYYDALPSEENDSTLSKTVDVLKFYSRIREFIKKVILNKHQLLQDLVFVHDKVHSLSASENNMLSFYDLEEKFLDVKAKANRFEEKDQKFSIYFSQINNFNGQFEAEVKKIEAAAADLFKLNDFFTEKLSKLEETNQEDKITNVLDKFDKVLTMTVRLIELKIDLENAIEEMKGGMIDLKDLRLKIEADILNVEKLTEFYLLQEREEGAQKKFKGTKLKGAITIFLVGLFFVW